MNTPDAHVLEWAIGLITSLILLVLGLYLRFTSVSRALTGIRTALLGYEGSGGIIHRLGNLEAQAATVDARVADSRHLTNNLMQSRLTEVETRILGRIEESDQRVHREIDDLKERRRP